MTSILPPIPRFVFTVFEPISLFAGFIAPFINPDWFVAAQVPLSPVYAIPASTRMIAYQLGNLYLLLALIGIAVLYTTTEAKVVRNYLIALWMADVGHIVITCYVMEYERFVDVLNWNAMAWGNIVATAFLFTVRTAYLLSLFGPDCVPQPTKWKDL